MSPVPCGNVLSKYACYHRYISNLPHSKNWEKKIADGPPCVVLASPGFLHSGASRELLELWAPDPRNGLIITGYSVEGTMARVSLLAVSDLSLYLVSQEIMNEPDEITGLKGNVIPRRLSVRYVSFSAHVDYSQNAEFIDLIGAKHIVSKASAQLKLFNVLLGPRPRRTDCNGSAPRCSPIKI